MNTVVRFSLPNGYRLIHRTRTVSLEEAAAILCTKRQRRYTSVSRGGDDRFVLRQDAVICPFCGHRTPAYDRFTEPKPAGYGEESRIPAPEINAWLTNLSLFEDEQKLILNHVWSGDGFSCGHCKMFSPGYENSCEVELTIDKGVIRFTLFNCSAGKDVSGYLMAVACRGQLLHFPLRETLCFAKGKTWLAVFDNNDQTVMIRDISVPNKDWSRSAAFNLLLRSRLARRKLAQAFAAVWGGPLPYAQAELNPGKFLELNRHRGFDRCFFDMLPFDDDGERSFRSASRRLRDARKLPKLYAGSGLPDKKSIRRNLFQMPYLFWYLPELRTMWKVFDNVDLFNAFLNRSVCCYFLAFLHFYPMAADFFRDCSAEKGAQGLLRILSRFDGAEKLQAYALRYSAGSEALRRTERKRWREWDTVLRSSFDIFPQGVKAGIRCRDVEISGGYSIGWLREKRQFVQAGEELGNCLSHYGPDRMKAAVVRKGAAILAAVEVRGDLIVQAAGHHNLPIDRESSLWKALVQWASICRFRFSLPDKVGELLPF